MFIVRHGRSYLLRSPCTNLRGKLVVLTTCHRKIGEYHRRPTASPLVKKRKLGAALDASVKLKLPCESQNSIVGSKSFLGYQELSIYWPSSWTTYQCCLLLRVLRSALCYYFMTLLNKFSKLFIGKHWRRALEGRNMKTTFIWRNSCPIGY